MENITTEQLEQELLIRYNSLEETNIDKKEEDFIYKKLKQIDGLSQYLTRVANQDVVKYFSATTDEQRALLKGSFARTLYIKNKLKDKKTSTKLEIGRYAK